MLTCFSKTDLELMVGKDEKVLWSGKPDKLCFILEGIFNPMLPAALIWFFFDSFFLLCIATENGGFANNPDAIISLVFLFIHMMPVWIYLGGVMLTFRRYQHTQYIVTDKGVYISGGMFSYTCNMKPFMELARVNIHRGVIDQMLGVGDIVLTSNNLDDMYCSDIRVNGRPIELGTIIADVRNYREVFEIIKKLQEDIYTDTMYPNALRPEENHGYHTKYKGL